MLKMDNKIKKIIACSQIVFLMGMVSNVPITTQATVESDQSIKNDEEIDMQSAPRVKGYILNDNNETIEYASSHINNNGDSNYNNEVKWTNKEVLIQASEVALDGESKSGEGIKGYKVICKKVDEGKPTEQEWKSIDESKLIKKNANSVNTDIMKISDDLNGVVYVKAVSNVNSGSNVSEINVKVKKTSPKKPNVTIEGINGLGWYTNGILKSGIKIENESTDIEIKTYVKVWNIENEDEANVETIDVSNGDYEKIVDKLKNNGKYKIQVWNKDSAGNISEMWPNNSDGQELKIDKNAPTDYRVEYQYGPISGVDIYDIYKDLVKVKIYSNDNISGIKEIIPKLQNSFLNKTIPYENLIVRNTDNGEAYVEFDIDFQFVGKISVDSIEDNAGNCNKDNLNCIQTSSNVNCIVDSEKPTEPIISSDEYDKENNLVSTYTTDKWTKSDVELSVSGAKVLSGIDHYEYVIKDNGDGEPTESEWEHSQSIGYNQLKDENKVDNSGSRVKLETINYDANKIYYVRAVSRVGIKGEATSIKVKVKKSIPVTPSVNIKKCNNYGWYTERLTESDISYSNYNTDIGLTTYAQIWNANNENDCKTIDISKYDKEEKISQEVIGALNNEGNYKIKIYTVDEAGNVSKSSPENSDGYSVNNDYSASNYFEIEYHSNRVTAINGYDIFSNNCVVRMYSKDDISGIRQINYHMENEYKSRTVNTNGIIKQDGDRQYVEFTIEPQYRGKVILDSVINNAGLGTIVNSSNSLVTGDKNTNIKNIIVDTARPNKPIISSGNYVNNSWTKENIDLQIEGSKALSGIKNYRYIVNNGEIPSDNQWNNSVVLNGDFKNNVRLTLDENLVSHILNLNSDLNKTYWFRAESNAGILGEISNYNVKIQKSAPRNTTIEYEESNSEGWYSKNPCIKLNDIQPLERQAPIYIHYKLWNKTAGETEDSVNEVVYNGNNLPEIASDGEYTLRVWTVDEVGNRSIISEDIIKDFNYDSTMPVISLNYDNNNSMNDKYYNKSRNATLTVNDTNFNPEKVNIRVRSVDNGNVIEMAGNSWSSDGISHSTTVNFDNDGDYQIEAVCTDKADNSSDTISDSNFIIDTTNPTLEISNVQDLSANNKDVNPLIEFNDTNIDFNNVEYTVTGLQNGVVSANASESAIGNIKNISLSSIDKDDNYVLLAKATDKAGNSIDKKVVFSVNKNGSTFEYLNNNITDGYVTKAFKPEIKINNIDEVTVLSLTLNGKPGDYTYQDGVLKFNNEIDVDGKYIINLDVKDAAGNTNSMQPVEFKLDQSRPKVLIDGVEDGKTYNDKVQITVSKDNSYDKFDSIELNDKNILEEATINSDGSVTFEVEDYDNYKLKIKASDDAGNVTDENIKFEISKSIFALSGMKKAVPLVLGAIVIILGAIFAKVKLFNKKKDIK